MGEVEEKLIEQMGRDGVPLPDKIANAPDLLQGLDLFYNAFQILSSCRSVGMGVGPIPWTAIIAYCNEYDIAGEQREDMLYHIDKLDSAYLDYANDDTTTPTRGLGADGNA